MAKALARRIARLERLVPHSAEAERANRILRAFRMMRDHPELATDEDREIAATTTHAEHQKALIVAVEASGGLEAVVLASMQLGKEAEEPAIPLDERGNPCP